MRNLIGCWMKIIMEVEEMADIEYIIVGDTERNKGCLVFTCGESKGRAEEILKRITTSPTENDKRIMEGIRILG